MTPFIAFSYRLCAQAVHGLNGFLNDTNILAHKADTRRAGRRVFFFPPCYFSYTLAVVRRKRQPRLLTSNASIRLRGGALRGPS